MPNFLLRISVILISVGLMWLYFLKIYQWTQDFQHSFFPRIEKKYQRFLAKILTGKKAWFALGGIIAMLVFSFVLLGVSSTNLAQ